MSWENCIQEVYNGAKKFGLATGPLVVSSRFDYISESKALTNMEKDNNDNDNEKRVYNDGKKLKKKRDRKSVV